MTTAYIDGANNSTGDPEYLCVETQARGEARFEIYSGGRPLAIDLDADAVKRLRQALDGAA